MRIAPTLRKSAAAVGLLTALSFFLAGNASAHAVVESTEPIANSVLDVSPANVTLRFNEPVDTELGWVRVFDADGQRVAAASVRHADSTNSVSSAMPELSSGGYVVVWRVVSSDGHPVEGAFTFQIGSGSAPVNPAMFNTVLTSQGGSELPGAVIGLMRVLGYIAAAVVIGIAVVGGFSVRAMRISAMLALVSAIVHLLFLGAYSVGGSIGDVFHFAFLGDAIGTRAGLMLLTRAGLFASVVALAGKVPVRAVAIAGAGAAFTVAFGGHSGAQSPAALMVMIGAVHIFSVWIWIGAVIVFAAVSRRDESYVGVSEFSRAMNIVLPAVVVTGVLTAGKNMDGWGHVFSETYGRLVIAKLAAVVLLLLAGLYLRRLLRTRQQGVRKLLAFEVLTGLCVFALTAFLSVTPPTTNKTNGDVFHSTLVEAGVMADVTIEPGTVGNNEIHLLFSPPGGSLAPVKDVRVRYSLPARGIPNMDATITVSAVNHWIGVMNIPYPGEWTVEVITKSSANETIRFTTSVAIDE